MAEDAGALLVRSGLIAEDRLLIARQAQGDRGGTIGEHLILSGFVDDQALSDFYRKRLMVPQVTMRQLARIRKDIIAKVPADMASEFRCVPVSSDRDGNLTVAMGDPSITHWVDELAFFTGHYVVRAVATQNQIAWCLAHYYGILTPLGQRLLRDPNSAAIPGPMPPASAFQATAEEPSGGRSRKPSITHQVNAERHNVVPPLSASAAPHDPTGAAGMTAAPADTSADDLPLRPPAMGKAPKQDNKPISSPIPVIIERDSRPLRPPPRQLGRAHKVVSFLHEDTAPTGPLRIVRRKRASNPPELTPKAGELSVATGPIEMLSGDELPPVVIELSRDTDVEALFEQRSDHIPLPLPQPGEQRAPSSSDSNDGEAAADASTDTRHRHQRRRHPHRDRSRARQAHHRCGRTTTSA